MINLASTIRHARETHEALYTDTVAVERHTGVTSDDLGTKTDHWGPVYTGPGLVQISTTKPQATDSTGKPVVVAEYIGKVPVSVLLEDGIRYRVRVTESLDPANLGTYEGMLAESNGLAITRRLHLVRTS